MDSVRSIRVVASLLTACTLFAATHGDSQAAENEIHIAHGNAQGYPFERVDFPAGEYFAMQCASGCELKKTTLLTRPATVATHDGDLQGYIVKLRDRLPNLFLVRGLPALKEGPVTTWHFNKRFQKAPLDISDGRLNARQERAFKVGESTLMVIGDVAKVSDPRCMPEDRCDAVPAVTWRVRFGTVERTIAKLTGSELGTPISVDDFVIWVGDLDGDGQPDLVVRPQDRPDYLEMSLFLSTTLSAGKPWRPSARFYFWDPKNHGC